MPSLSDQLRNLREPVSRSLGVEREHSSLLFDRKDAAAFSTEEYYNLGLSGLEQLRKVDRSFADNEEQLFEPMTITLNRAMLLKEENDDLNRSLDRMIIYLAPYFNHQGCKQVLEWLIHKYHIHLYNATTLINAFIVYHSTNSFGRLLKILKIDRPEWEFVGEFSQKALPIPFNSIVKACLKGGSNHFLIASYSTFLQQTIQLVGEKFVNERMHMHFTFYTSVVVHLFKDTANITEQLISRIVPFVGTALRSKVLPFKLSGFVIVCDLVICTALNEETLMNILNLTLLKMQPEWFEMAMNTVLVTCQRQDIKALPKKALLKLIRKQEDLNLSQYLVNASAAYDLTGFILPFVNTTFECLTQTSDIPTRDLIINSIKTVLNLETMNTPQASAVINACFDQFLADENGQVPEGLCLLMKQIIIRFVNAFDPIRARIMITNKEALQRLQKQCGIADHEIGLLNFEDKKRRRRRSSQSRNYEEVPSEDEEMLRCNKPKIEKTYTAEEQIKNLQQGEDLQQAFKKPPSVVLDMLKAKQVEQKKLEWMLTAFESEKYLAKQSMDELEDFLVGVISYIATNPSCKNKSLLKQALLKIKVSETLMLSLILPHEAPNNKAKRKRLAKFATDVMSVFDNESEAEFEIRLTFALELFVFSSTFKATRNLLRQLFELIEITDKPPKGYGFVKNRLRIQQLTLALIYRIFKEQDASSLVGKQLNVTSLVNTIQFTHDMLVLQNALKVLTYVAPLIPTQLTSQIMSLFTFMGNGLLKKDNELTLRVLEEALRACFSAILNENCSSSFEYQCHLQEVSQIFAKSVPDIPVHRFSRLLKALAICVQPEHLWIVFASILNQMNNQCKKEQSKDELGNSLSNICLDLVSNLQPEQQLIFVLKTLDYIISLGSDSDAKSVTSPKSEKHLLIFDRKNKPNKDFRYYRYTALGCVLQTLNRKTLPVELAELSNESICERLASYGNMLIKVMHDLENFAVKEASIGESKERNARGKETAIADLQTFNYWVLISARTDNIVKRLRSLLPEEVRVHLVLKLVNDPDADKKLCELAPRLLGVKLPDESSDASEEVESKSFEDQLNDLMEKLNAEMTTPSNLPKLILSLDKLLESPEATEQIEELAPQLLPLFFKLFNVRQQTSKKATLEDIQESEQCISRAFVSLSENLSEEQLKPVFSRLSDWVAEALQLGADLASRYRVLTVYNIANRFYEHYNNLALAYFSQLFVYAPNILKQLNAAKVDDSDLFLDGTDATSPNAAIVNDLISSVIDFISNCAKHSFFMGDDRAESVYETVLDEIENQKVHGYKKRCMNHLVNCIYHLSESAPDLFTTSLCTKLLDKTYNPSARVRLQTLAIFEELIGRIGDALAPLLFVINPRLSELLEDENPKVVERCEFIIRELRAVFGEDFLNDR